LLPVLVTVVAVALGRHWCAQRVRQVGQELPNTSHLAEPTPRRTKISAFMLRWSTHPFWVYSNPSPRGGRSAAYRACHEQRGRVSASVDRGGGSANSRHIRATRKGAPVSDLNVPADRFDVAAGPSLSGPSLPSSALSGPMSPSPASYETPRGRKNEVAGRH